MARARRRAFSESKRRFPLRIIESKEGPVIPARLLTEPIDTLRPFDVAALNHARRNSTGSLNSKTLGTWLWAPGHSFGSADLDRSIGEDSMPGQRGGHPKGPRAITSVKEFVALLSVPVGHGVIMHVVICRRLLAFAAVYRGGKP